MTILGIPIELYAAYVLACTAVVIVPGPSVTVIIANSLRHGVKAGLLECRRHPGRTGDHAADPGHRTAVHRGEHGTGVRHHQVDRCRLSDLAWRQIAPVRRHNGQRCRMYRAQTGRSSGRGCWWCLSNPKALFFFGALIPQFLTAGGNALAQTLLAGRHVHRGGHAAGLQLRPAGRRSRKMAVAHPGQGTGSGQRTVPDWWRHLAGAGAPLNLFGRTGS